MDIRQYLDSTYLKTAQQANKTEEENLEIVKNTIQEAIDEKFKLVMIRPEAVMLAKQMIIKAESKVAVGTVIDFPFGNSSLEEKLYQAEQAVKNGADELDFVVDYEKFKQGKTDEVKEQVLECTRFGLLHNKIVKWIIETAALNDHEIVQICALIKNIVISNFDENDYGNVFVKSSTGFYETQNGLPNGATVPVIKLMIENSFPLLVKASGGVRTTREALEMVGLGVKRIGTSSAKAIVSGVNNSDGDDY